MNKDGSSPVGDPNQAAVVPVQPGTPVVAETPAKPEGEAAVVGAGSQDADLATKVERLETDMNRLRGIKDREVEKVRRDAEDARRKYEADLDAAKMAGMDDNARTKYELERTKARLQEAELKVQAAEAARAQIEATKQAADWFTQVMGIPSAELVLDQGIETLVASGYAAMKKQQDQLTKELAKLKGGTAAAPVTPKPGEVTPPQVANTQGGAATGNTWPTLLKALSDKLGRKVSEEDVWRMVERGQLAPSILPQPKTG